MINLLKIANPPADGHPGTHALVIGLSAYPFLGGGAEFKQNSADFDFKMEQLTSPAISAFYVAHWLRQAAARLPAPLASCRLLLAPSPEELARIQALDSSVRIHDTDGRFETLADALHDWRRDAARNKNNVAWFYFSGHGMQFRNALLLTTEYNQKKRVPFNGAVDFGEVLDGMMVTQTFPYLAQQQFYMIDACRSQAPDLSKISNSHRRSVWVTRFEATGERRCTIIYATRTGAPAYGQHLRPTPFARALIRALRNDAADNVKGNWVVETDNLIHTLRRLVPAYARTFTNQKQEIECGQADPLTWVRLDTTPSFKVTIRLKPPEAHPPNRFVLTNRDNDQTRTVNEPQHPYTVRLAGGSYQAAIDFATDRPFGEVRGETWPVFGPHQRDWEIRCPPRS